MSTVTTSTARHLLLRFTDGARLPEALVGSLRDEVVLAGWFRASGVLADIQLRAYDSRTGGLGSSRRIAGPAHAVVLEGSIGLTNGDVTCGLRAVLSFESDTGVQTIAGEIADARIVALEAMVMALDEAAAARSLDGSGVWLFNLGASASGSAGSSPRAPTPPAAPPARPAPPAPPPQWQETVRVSDAAPAPPAPPKHQPGPRPSPTYQQVAMPQRPVKPEVPYEEVIYPEAGDTCEHFAFGQCEVVKSDGDRLHVRLGKDNRIKEISLDMLKVSPLPSVEGSTKKHFKLDRRL